MRTVENSSVLVMENATSPAAVGRSFPKNCTDVQMRVSFIEVRKCEVRCLVVYPYFSPMRDTSSYVCLKSSVNTSPGSHLQRTRHHERGCMGGSLECGPTRCLIVVPRRYRCPVVGVIINFIIPSINFVSNNQHNPVEPVICFSPFSLIL